MEVFHPDVVVNSLSHPTHSCRHPVDCQEAPVPLPWKSSQAPDRAPRWQTTIRFVILVGTLAHAIRNFVHHRRFSVLASPDRVAPSARRAACPVSLLCACRLPLANHANRRPRPSRPATSLSLEPKQHHAPAYLNSQSSLFTHINYVI